MHADFLFSRNSNSEMRCSASSKQTHTHTEKKNREEKRKAGKRVAAHLLSRDCGVGCGTASNSSHSNKKKQGKIPEAREEWFRGGKKFKGERPHMALNACFTHSHIHTSTPNTLKKYVKVPLSSEFFRVELALNKGKIERRGSKEGKEGIKRSHTHKADR